MANRLLSIRTILFLLFLFAIFLFLSLGTRAEGQNEKNEWQDNLLIMREFLNDSRSYLSRFMSIEDINYWTEIYYLAEGEKDYVGELLDRQFAIADVDDKKLDVLFSVLIKYSGNYDTINGQAYPIIERLVEIFESRSGLFSDILFCRPDWKVIIRLISKWEEISATNGKKSFKEKIIAKAEGKKKEEIKLCFDELEEEIDSEYIWLMHFVKEPDKYVAGAGNIKNWGAIISRYWQKHTDENLIIKDDALKTIIKWIIQEPNETMIKVLFILIKNFTSDYPAEVIGEAGARVFLSNPQLFIRCLEKYNNWRSLLLSISNDLLVFEYNKEINLKEKLNGLRDEGFEGAAKRELDFIVGLLSGYIEKNIRRV